MAVWNETNIVFCVDEKTSGDGWRSPQDCGDVTARSCDSF